MMKLPKEYFLEDDVLFLSENLLGKVLLTQIDGILTGGIIVETEAYKGPEDRASHAYQMKKTPRNTSMYLEGGNSYIFHCYGIHTLFNIVTNVVNIPHAILIRAIQPIIGIEEMLKRRKKQQLEYSLTAGPGSVSKALGMNLSHNGISLTESIIWIEEYSYYSPHQILRTPRVGIDYAGADALLPWRFRIKNNPWTSRPK